MKTLRFFFQVKNANETNKNSNESDDLMNDGKR